MENSDSMEEEVTDSHFNSLLTYNLDINVSKNIFKSRFSDITSIKLTGTANSPFLSPKSFTNSVFDRLITDSNRRICSDLKLKNYRIMREQEYENSLLSPVRISKESESNLIARLVSDSERRIKEKNLRESSKSEEKDLKIYPKQSAAKVEEVVNRLFADKRKDIEKREKLKKSAEEREISSLKNIRERHHPIRKINQEALLKISQRSPRCKHLEENESKEKRSWKDTKHIIDRLCSRGSLGNPFPIVGNKTKASPVRSTNAAEGIKLEDFEKDEFLMKLKATIKQVSSISK